MSVLALREHEIAELLGCLIVAADSHLEVTVLRLDLAGRQLEVLSVQRSLDVGDRQIASSERHAIDPHAHRRTAGPEDVDLRDAWNRGETVQQVPLHVIRELHHAHGVAGEREPHHGLLIRVGFLYADVVDVVRQSPRHAGHAVTHVVRGLVEPAVQVELDRDRRLAVSRGRANGLDAFNARELALEHLRHACFDDLRRRARIVDLHLDGRGHGVGIFAHCQVAERQRAERDQHEAQHGREDRPFDGGI